MGPVLFCFLEEYVDILMDAPSKWHHVLVENAKELTKRPPKYLTTQIPIAYPQGTKNRCLFLCMALALHYMDLKQEAAEINQAYGMAENVPGPHGLKALKKAMIAFVPILGRPIIFNSCRKKERKEITVHQLTLQPTPYPTVVIPVGNDGSVNHAFCVVNDLILNSTQAYALKCNKNCVNWIVDGGRHGIMTIAIALRFQFPIKCKAVEPTVKTNWK